MNTPTSSNCKTKSVLHFLFKGDRARHEGVARINILLLRALYLLMAVFVGKDSWSYLLTQDGAWNPIEAVSWCVWAAFSALAVLGIFHPLKMIPIVLLEIFYKTVWLIVVAYPLWSAGQLQGSPAEGLTHAFIWVLLPIVAVPWGYVWKTFINAPSIRAA